MFGNTNIIFNATSSQSRCDNHVGCLSIKTVLTGEEWYGINGTNVAVRPGTFLLLNDGQNYSCRINDNHVRTVSVFFARDFAASVLRDSSNDLETVIDNPLEVDKALPEFFQTLHPLDHDMNQRLLSLINSVNALGYDHNMVDEHLIFLLHDLLSVHRKDIAASKRIHGIRSSTQKEIFKRVCIARDLLHSFHYENPRLKWIASASSLSVPQLVRQFKASFGVTPHRYLMTMRLENAGNMLRDTNLPVTEVASHCGFEDASVFARAFKGRFGLSPVAYRVK